MKRAALFLLLLAATARGDNAFHVDLTLKTNGAKPPPQGIVTRRFFAGGVAIGGRARAQMIFHGGGIITFGNANGNDDSGQDAAPQTPLLRWKNGETLPGDLIGTSEGVLAWKSPLFDDPLEVKWDVIDRIDWPAVPQLPKDAFSIALRDGSFIYGDLVAVGADTISIHSTRHGDAMLKRADVLSIRRRAHDSLIYNGPTGDAGWQAMINQQDGTVVRGPDLPEATRPVVSAPGGALLIRSWNRSALLDLKLPAAIDVAFQVHSSKRPEFVLALGGNVHEPLRIETWDNVLVLAAGDQFKIIRRIQDDERVVTLRVCWDKSLQECLVFSPSGELLTSWKTPNGPATLAPGLVVQNRGLDLSVDMLRVRAWDGKEPAKINLDKPHLELSDGRCVPGPIVAGPADSVSVQVPSQASPAGYPVSQVDAVIFSSDRPAVSGHEASLAFNDGTLLYGRLASLDNGRALFDTDFSGQPLPVRMDSPRQLLTVPADLPSGAPTENAPPANAPAENPLDVLDKIVVQDTTLHGKLGTSADGSLAWLPVGGVKPARPSLALSSEITRAVPKDAPLSSDPALFYLSSGDVLPGSLESVDRSGVDFSSSLMAQMKLPGSQLEAIEFSSPTRMNVQGFSDPAWEIIKGDDKSVRRTGNNLEMDAGTAITLPSLMQCGEFSFKYSTNGFSALRVRLFSAGKDESNTTSILMCASGAQFTAGLESVPGQFDSQFQIRTQPGNAVTVRFKVENSAVNLYVNDIPVGPFPIDLAKCAGSGVILEPASVWGNGAFPVSLTEFSAQTALGRSWLPVVSSDIRNQVLTVPRFERDDPPRHVLLAANGDVLRGEIEAATDTHFGFRCGLQELTVPRDRVRAVIWLQPPSKDAPPTTAPTAANPDDPTPSDPLADRLQMRVSFQQIDLNSILNFLRSQDQGLKIQAPDEAIGHRIEGIRIGQQTIADALTEICARFNLHYRLDPDGTIVLETPTTSGNSDLVTRTYWVKPGALPATGSAHDLLAAKGLTFPKDSAVEWHPSAGVVTMQNTVLNQAKLAALLASDYGGCLGSPTHWIELTSGARLALAVDRFTPDAIFAHQPMYGEIKVPMAQVYTIRTTAPEPTTTSRALAGWRLVNAPEPVIPEGNGQNSPLLGKDAALFTLPLLAGGDFDLASEKGHIVVLDFWASWCGPCVRSLPGLVDSVGAFPPDKVKLIGINQGEAPDQVKHFLEARGLKLTVAMDADQGVGRKYGVDAIPRTIVVGPDGKVAWEQTGYDPDGEGAVADAIKKLLDPPPAADPPAPHPAQ
jgi:thiol-disulfide isomerase/thioredoxin